MSAWYFSARSIDRSHTRWQPARRVRNISRCDDGYLDKRRPLSPSSLATSADTCATNSSTFSGGVDSLSPAHTSMFCFTEYTRTSTTTTSVVVVVVVVDPEPVDTPP